jgi:hypothetical protein
LSKPVANESESISTALAESAGTVPDTAKVARPLSITRNIKAIKHTMGNSWLPRLYRERIMKLRTRSHQLPVLPLENRVDIHHTLLGVELKSRKRRLLCPDLATARYLAVFARAGCTHVAIPYDITKISLIADELESSWHRMLLLVDDAAEGRSSAFRSRLRAGMIGEVRREISEAGPGTAIPQFNQNTKQRRA